MNKSVKSLILTENYRQQLCHPERWTLISSLLPPDIESVKDAERAKWLETHSDSHLHRELLFALKGNSMSSLNGLSYPCSPCTIYLFDSEEEHDLFYSPDTNNIVHLWLYFVGSRIIARLISVNNGRLEVGCKSFFLENTSLCDLINREWNELKSSSMDTGFKRKKLFSLLLLLFMELIELDTTDKVDKKNNRVEIVRIICLHIDNTSGKGLTIEKLAKIAGYSKFHFMRMFKEYTGQSIREYINIVRRRKVKSMQEAKFMKKEISEELGFSSPAAFSHWYSSQKDI